MADREITVKLKVDTSELDAARAKLLSLGGGAQAPSASGPAGGYTSVPIGAGSAYGNFPGMNGGIPAGGSYTLNPSQIQAMQGMSGREIMGQLSALAGGVNGGGGNGSGGGGGRPTGGVGATPGGGIHPMAPVPGVGNMPYGRGAPVGPYDGWGAGMGAQMPGAPWWQSGALGYNVGKWAPRGMQSWLNRYGAGAGLGYGAYKAVDAAFQAPPDSDFFPGGGNFNNPNSPGGAGLGRYLYNATNYFGVNDFLWSKADRAGGFGNIQNRMEAVGRERGVSASGTAFTSGVSDIRAGEFGMRAPIQTAVNDARAAQKGAVWYEQQLQNKPGLLASFNTFLPEVGVQNAATGGVRKMAVQAGAAAVAARAATFDQHGLVLEAQTNYDAARKRTDDAIMAAGGKSGAVNAIMSGQTGVEGTKRAAAAAEALGPAIAGQAQVQDALRAQAQARLDLETQIKELADKQTAAAQARAVAGQAELNVQRNKLDLLKEQAHLGRTGAEQIGMMDIGQRELLKFSAEQLGGGVPIDMMAPQMKAALAANPITRERFFRAGAAQARPFANEVDAAAGGRRVGDFLDRERQVADKNNEINLEDAAVGAGAADQVRRAWEKAGGDLGQLITDGIDAMMKALVAQQNKDAFQQQQQHAVAVTK